MTLSKKYKIVRKVSEHNRKKRRWEKKNGSKLKKEKDPGIPNAWPFKDQMVKELQARKAKADAETAQKKMEKKLRQVRPFSPARHLHVEFRVTFQPTQPTCRPGQTCGLGSSLVLCSP